MTPADTELVQLWRRWGGISGLVAAQRSGMLTGATIALAAAAAIRARDAGHGPLTTVVDPPLVGEDGLSRDLAGIPFAAKENMDVAGLPTSAGAGSLGRAAVAAHHSAIVAAALAAGGTLVGRGAMPELATAAVTVGPAFGAIASPLDPARTAGGSSGGTAAAVADGLTLVGIGSDTGGSVTIPASCTGIFGYRPSLGRLPTSGIVPFSSTFDTPGLLCRTAGDLVVAQRALSPSDHPSRAGGTLRVGVAGGLFDDHLHEDVRAGRDRLVEALSRVGVVVGRIAPPVAPLLFEAIRTVAWHEAARAWTRLRAEQPEFAPSDAVQQRIEHGLRITPQQHREALQERERWIGALGGVFDAVDVIVSPTIPSLPPRIDELDVERDTVALTRLTYPWCFAGLPSVSVPVGDAVELRRPRIAPIGMQLTGPAGSDAVLLALAARLERDAEG